jgi:type II secretory pathway predicted ATPase ExeA/tetratricopeptide (TPR) repeat protein
LGPDGLESSRDHVRVAANRVSLDIGRLEVGDVLGSEVREALEVGAFLDGFDIPDSAEFSHWKDRQQARLLPRIKDALVVLIDRCRRTGDTRQIEHLADRMLALDELSEEAIRAKMEARAFAGDRLTALEIFESWKTKLADELDALPSDLVEGMAVRLRRRGWERTTLPKVPNVPTDQWRGRPFIGRTAEYRILYEAWDSTRRGLPRHALILGDSGVGKTTLVQRLTTAAGLEGAAISRVQCYDLEREIPYSTLSSLVLGLLDRPGVSATAPEALAELARTIPEIRRRFPNVPPPSDSQGETARIRLTEAFLEMLSAIAEEHPVVLVVDDLHLADDISLAVLHLIMRRLGSRPIMVILLARPGELVQSPQASKLREGGTVLDVCEVELRPLTISESEEMLSSLLPTDAPAPSSTAKLALLRAAAGYPMVLELLVQDWQHSGGQSLALSIDSMTEDPASENSIRLPYRQILERITRSLDSTTHNVLNLASLLGQRLNDLGMYAVVDLSVGQTMSGMSELVSRRVLRDGVQGLEFVNEMVRASAYLGVPASMRKVLHSKIADRFIEEHTSGHDDLGLEIAWHCVRAARHQEATPYLLQGAREAIQCGAPNEAERALTTALPHLAGLDENDALVLLAEAFQEQCNWEESLTALDRVDPRMAGSSTDLAFVLRVRAQRRLGQLGSSGTDLASALLHFIRSVADPSSRIKAAVEAASVVDLLKAKALIPEIMESISSLSHEVLETDDAARLLLVKAMLQYNSSDFEESLRNIAKAQLLLESNHNPNSVLAMLHNGVGAIRTKSGAYEDSVTAYVSCQQTALKIGNDNIYLQAAANLALSLTRLGRYDEAVHWSEKPLQYRHPDMGPGFVFQAAESALLSWAMMGKSEKVEELMRTASERFARSGLAGIKQGWTLYSADAYAMLGRTEEAIIEGRRGTQGDNAQLHMDFYIGPFARWTARSVTTADSSKSALRRIEKLAENLNSYDAIDQAEILNARCYLESRNNQASTAHFCEMMKALRALPGSVAEQWKRMGLLEFTQRNEQLGAVPPDSTHRPAHAF